MADLKPVEFNPIIWENGSTVVRGFIDPTHLMVYLTPKDPNCYGDVILRTSELEEIVRAVNKRQDAEWVRRYGGHIPKERP